MPTKIIPGNCAYCGVPLVLVNSHRKKFCDVICYANSIRGDRNHKWQGGLWTDREHQLWRARRAASKRRAIIRTGLGTHSLKEWEDLKKFFGYQCVCCQKKEPQIVLVQDHIIPLSKGGSDDISNIQPLCGMCNSKKYNKLFNYIPIFQFFKEMGWSVS